jgi:hypothetical protein
MLKTYVAAICAVAAMTSATSAGAVVMVATYSGGTNGFGDSFGVFGFASDNGSNSINWSATFTYDTALDYQQVGTIESARGIGATLTVNGYTINIGGVGVAFRNSLTFGDVRAYGNTQSDGIYNLTAGLDIPTNGALIPGTTVSLETEAVVSGGSACSISRRITGNGVYGTLCGTSAQFARAPIQPVPSGPVPEPSTWALLIGGFGMAGAMLRRRRAAVAT